MEFRFVDATGKLVLDFFADYVTSSASCPSGYGSLGVSGSDGKMVVGSAGDVLSVDTSISRNLNQSPEFYRFAVDSPAPESNYPTWDFYDSYTVVVSKNAFGASSFGGVSIPKPVTWTGSFESSTAGMNIEWKWAAAVYKQFNADGNSLGIKPVDGDRLSVYRNTDHAGVPENLKKMVISGARGGGGPNCTGSYTVTGKKAPCFIPPGGGQ